MSEGRWPPPPYEPWWSTAPTEAVDVVQAAEPASLRQQLQEAPGFSTRALVLAVVGSVVGAALTTAVGTGPLGSLAGAAFAPIISTTFATRRTGEKGRVRTAAILVLSLSALAITWGGVSVADVVAGRSVLPGSDARAHTFPVKPEDVMADPKPDEDEDKPEVDPPDRPLWAVVATAAVDCGTAEIGATITCTSVVTMTNVGTRRVRVTSLERTGEHADDFAAEGCVDERLDTGETCAITIRFAPTSVGAREATLVVHQTLPPPDRGTGVRLTGYGEGEPSPCLAGFVPREAVAGDDVCVLPETHDQAQLDNSLAESRRDPDGGEYGADTCLRGFVWRGATPPDHVCVTGEIRDQTAQDNALADSRRAN